MAGNAPLFGDDDSDDSSDSDNDDVQPTTEGNSENTNPNGMDDANETETDEPTSGAPPSEDIKNNDNSDANSKDNGEENEKNQDKLEDTDEDEDDDNDNDDDENKNKNTNEKKTNNKTQINDDNENEDDEDNEFKDDDEIFGRTKNEEELEHERQMQQAQMREKHREENPGLDEVKEELLPLRKFSVLDIPPPVPPSNQKYTNTKNPKQVTMHMTKLPNIVNINVEAYDKDIHDPDLEEKAYNGYVYNMIRWRYKRNPETGDYLRDANGKLMRESNSKIVKWSDGSLTLHVGTEVFEVDSRTSNPTAKNNQLSKAPSAITNQFPGMNGYLYLSQKAILSPDDSNANSNTMKPMGTVLECMGPIESKLIPRPSLKSEAHKNLTLAVHKRSMKGSRIAEYVTQVDPEKANNERIKNRDDLNRSKGGRRSSAGGAGARGGGAASMHRRRAGRKFYRDYDDSGRYDSVSIRQMKNGMDDDDEYHNVREDSDSEDGHAWRNRKKHVKKNWAEDSGRYARSDDEDDDNVGGAESESDEEDFNLNTRKRKSRGNVFDDDDD